jgi:hypothetical protein
MVFCIVYTPRARDGAAGADLVLFRDWRPPLAFTQHWRFAAGGGIGLVEAGTAAELSRAIDPFAPFFAFQVARLEDDEDGATSLPALASTPRTSPERLAFAE